MSDLINMVTTYPQRYHCVQFLEDAVRGLGVEVEFARDERTEGCYGLIIQGKPMVWLIDNRNSHEAVHEDVAADRLLRRGVPVFHAQRPDKERVGGRWLPIAVTPGFGLPQHPVAKQRTAAFVGYPRDANRAAVLDYVRKQIDLNIAMYAFGDDANRAYHEARVGLNVPVCYGEPHAYDVNMRVFEVCATGTPLVTNHLPELYTLGLVPGEHLLAYRDKADIVPCIEWLLRRPAEAATLARNAYNQVMARHTYRNRALEVLEVMRG